MALRRLPLFLIIIALLAIAIVPYCFKEHFSPQSGRGPILGNHVAAPVPGNGISAGTTILITDIYTRPVPITKVYSQTILQADELSGMLALESLLPGEPVQWTQVDDPEEIWVPRRFITATTPLTSNLAITDPQFMSKTVGARSITTDTLITLAHIVPDDKTAKAAVHLLRGQALVSSMVSHEDKPTPVVTRYVATRPLPALLIVTEEDRECHVEPSEEEEKKEPCAGITDPQHHVLLKAIKEGDPIQASDVTAITTETENVVELTVHISEALSGMVLPGDIVNVYASARVFTDTKGTPFTLYEPDPADPFKVENALVLGIAPSGDKYRVTLGVSDEDVKTIAQVKPFVEFILALRPK